MSKPWISSCEVTKLSLFLPAPQTPGLHWTLVVKMHYPSYRGSRKAMVIFVNSISGIYRLYCARKPRVFTLTIGQRVVCSTAIVQSGYRWLELWGVKDQSNFFPPKKFPTARAQQAGTPEGISDSKKNPRIP